MGRPIYFFVAGGGGWGHGLIDATMIVGVSCSLFDQMIVGVVRDFVLPGMANGWV